LIGAYGCGDIDECNDSPCDANASCNNIDGGYECSCNSGYSGDGASCADVDECASNPCSANGKCSNTDGGFECACNRGFSGDGFDCADIDECADSPCDANASCSNNDGGFECSCNDGYAGDGYNCSDIDECANIECGDNSSCQNTDGGYTCVCNNGYEDKNGKCVDVNECKSKPCGDNAYCVNKPGRFVCKCRKGYFGNGDNCADVDECANGKAECADNASCSNTVGSYECSCNDGYQGNGKSCSDVNECFNNPCASNANCANNDGGYECTCRSGFEMVGDQCEDIDECTSGDNVCDANADCNNSNGSYGCACKSGFIGNGRACSQVYSSNSDNQVFDANGNLVTVDQGDDRFEGVAGSNGVNSFNGDFGSNSYGFSNSYGDDRNDYGAYSYSDPFTGLAYGAGDVNAGKFGVAGPSDTDTQWWSFMHNMWNHVQDSHRFFKRNKNSRNWKYPGKAGYDVTSNLAMTTHDGSSFLGGRYDHSQHTMEGLYGKTLNQFLEENLGLTANPIYPKNSPWKALDDNDAADTDTTWGYDGYMGASDIGSYHDKMDSSWELGSPTLSGQESNRWFENSASNGASSYQTDTARLSCFHCEVQYALKWDHAARQFRQYRQGASTAAATGETAWDQCRNGGGSSKKCEYSSGVCFVEERRTFGYITLVRKGCKQAKACYMNKYQNFLVQAGRQCWPGDHKGMVHKVARRPYDVKADEWIYNLLAGGEAAGTSALAESFKDNDFSTVDKVNSVSAGFYIERPATSAQVAHQEPIDYRNGFVFTSWCYQCCNTGFDCNQDWVPETERDWAQNWLKGGGTPTDDIQ